MKSRVVGIIKFEAPRMDGRVGDLGLNFPAGDEGRTLEAWLSALAGEGPGVTPRWESRGNLAAMPRRVRANLEKLAAELDREYLELAAT
jgi:hypothetical protein